jgi:hypothetical protein
MKVLAIGATAFLLAQAAAAADPPPAPPPAPTAAKPSGPDRLELDAAEIRGNQELPKVLYIVPWKDPGAAEPAGRPLNSLLDEALGPVDREVFRRQMRYFDQLYAPAAAGPGDGAKAQ